MVIIFMNDYIPVSSMHKYYIFKQLSSMSYNANSVLIKGWEGASGCAQSFTEVNQSFLSLRLKAQQSISTDITAHGIPTSPFTGNKHHGR